MPTTQAFSVTTPQTAVRTQGPPVEFPVTVRNAGAHADRVDVDVEAVTTGVPGADPGWFTVKGRPLPALEPLPAGASVTVVVTVTLPVPPPADGTYGIRAVAYSADGSHEETLSRGPDMTVQVALPVPVPRPPWWRRYWWAIALAVVLVVVVVVVVVVLNRKDPAPVDRTLSASVAAPIGASFDPAHKRLVVAEFGGRIAAVDTTSGATTTLGTGYQQLEDVLVLPGGDLVVSERTGALLRLPGTGAPRAGATLLATGLVAPQQMALTADGKHLFVVEFTDPGRLLRIDLGGVVVPPPTVVATGLHQPIGLAVDKDGTTAFVTEQATQSLRQIPLQGGGAPTVIAGTLPSAFFLSWTDSSRKALLVAQRSPVDAVRRITLSSRAVEPVVPATPPNPSSVVPVGGTTVAVQADTEIHLFTVR